MFRRGGAEPGETIDLAGRHQAEVVQQNGHMRIEHTLFAHLEPKAFTHIPRPDPGWFTVVYQSECVQNRLLRHDQTVRDLRRIGPEVAVFVQILDQISGDPQRRLRGRH